MFGLHFCAEDAGVSSTKTLVTIYQNVQTEVTEGNYLQDELYSKNSKQGCLAFPWKLNKTDMTQQV
jgi:hypothetical protein